MKAAQSLPNCRQVLTKALLILGCAFGALAGCQFAVQDPADSGLKGTQPGHWRVVWKTDPATEATISWDTVEAGNTHRVYLRFGDDEQETVVTCQRNGRYTPGTTSSGVSQRVELYYHHAKLTQLRPATKYTVVLESDGKKSPQFYFITAPSEDQPVSLLYGADSVRDRAVRRKMNRMISNLVQAHPAILALAHGGDYAFHGDDLTQWFDWLTDHELTVASDGRLLPIIPARGDHENGPLYNEAFDFPPNDRNYYALNVGPNVRLVTLNTNISISGDQSEWLEGELRKSRPDNRWLVAQYHEPAYPAVKRPSDAHEHWVPLFDKYHVDLVCEADGHTIKRTVPIREDKPDPSGTVYIGEGGLGAKQRTPRTGRWYLQNPGKAGKGHHVQLLSFDAEGLKYQVILLGGEVFDRHTIEAREYSTTP